MKPYPVDLRSKIVTAYKNNEGSMLKLACQYGVSRSFVQKMIKQEKETGNVMSTGNGNRNSKLRGHTELVKRLIEANPSLSLREMCQAIRQETGIEVSLSTMHRFIRKID